MIKFYLFIFYILVCTSSQDVALKCICGIVVVVLFVLAYLSQKKSQSGVLYKKDDEVSTSFDVNFGKNNVIVYKQKIPKKNLMYNVEVVKIKKNIIICLFTTIYIFISTYIHQSKFIANQEKIGCYGSKFYDRVGNINVTGKVISVQNNNYILLTKFGLLQSRIFADPVFSQDTILLLQGSIQCTDLKQALPYSYIMSSYAKNILGILSATNIVEVSSSKKPIPKQNRMRFSSEYNGLPEGVLLGVTEFIPKSIYQLFIDSGLVYLIAASGGNISLLVGCVLFLLLFVVIKKRNIIACLHVLVYGYLLRSNISIVRSILSYMLTFISLRAGRHVKPKNILIIVVCICALYNPYMLVTSRGLLLSVAGLRGIFHIPHTLQKSKILYYIAPSIRAFIGLCGPLLVLTQKINFLTVVASIPAQLLAVVITFVSLRVLVFGGGFLYGGKILFWSVKGLLYVAAFTSAHGLYIQISSAYIGYLLWFFTWMILALSSHILYSNHMISTRD